MSFGGEASNEFCFYQWGMHFSVYSFIVSFISQKIKRGRNDSSHFSFIFVNAFGFVGKNVKLLTLIFQKIKQLFVGDSVLEKIFSYVFLLFQCRFCHVVKMRRILKQCLRGMTILKVCIFYFKCRLKE